MRTIKPSIKTVAQAKALQQEIAANATTTPAFGLNNDIRQCVFNYEHAHCSIEIEGVEFRITDGFIRKHRGERFKTYILYVNGQAWDEFFSIECAQQHLNEVYVINNSGKIVGHYGDEIEAKDYMATYKYDHHWEASSDTFEEYLAGLTIVSQAFMYARELKK